MRSSKRARSFQRRKGSREDEQSEDEIARTKGKRSKERVVNSKRVTRSISVIVTERRARQSERQEKGSGVRAELPFLDRFKPELEALVELNAAKTHTVLYQINRTEYYCQVDLPLSDYPLYGKQSAKKELR